jgi:energy-coupling factor transporter ATP-binding protein EcfA2
MSDKDSIGVLRPKQLVTAIRACISVPKGETLLIKGAPGIGKTDLVFSAAEAEKHEVILSHPPVEDPTDSKGIPWYDPKTERMRFMPVGQIAKVLEAKRPTVWFIDDLGQAPESVQKAYMQWCLAREVDGNRLPDCVKIVAATNRRSDRAGVSGILEPVKSRFTIVEMEPNVEDWSEWALDHDQPPEVIAYLRNVKTEAFNKFEPTVDISNSPCPRNWAAVGRILNMNLADTDVRFSLFIGRVGEAAATEFNSYLKIVEQAPSFDEVIRDPKHCKIPDNPAALYALSSTIAHRADVKNFGKVSVYVQRMHAAEKGEFCAFLLRDMLRKTREIKDTPEFAQLAKTKVAQDVFEAVASAKQ